MTHETIPGASARRRWRDFWARQTTPLHTGETEDDYAALADELRLLFTGDKPDRVLDIGCGNGALFTPLGFDTARRYLGVDFSHSMLTEFRARYPGIQLVEADATDFTLPETFDLIFSSHIAQYWDRRQMSRHLDHARQMIAGNGCVVIAGIPWSRMRRAEAWGDLAGGDRNGRGRRTLPGAVWAAGRELVSPLIGHWYDFADLNKLAAAHDFRAAFRGSGYYPYRFHAILRPSSNAPHGRHS